MIEWGWDRAACETYIHSVLGAEWVKSACVFCPYALLNRAGRARVTDAYRHHPQAGVQGLLMEHLAVSLNPRQGLAAGRRLADLLAGTPGQERTLRLFHARLDEVPWCLYEVRRAVLPKAGHAGRAVRSLRAHASGTRTQMAAALARVAAARRLPVTAEDGIDRAWHHRRGTHLPTAEWFLVAAPHGADDKEGPGFTAAWPRALAGHAHHELPTHTAA